MLTIVFWALINIANKQLKELYAIIKGVYIQMKKISSFFIIIYMTAPAFAAEPVNIMNFKRAETHSYMKARAEAGCFGKLCSERVPMLVDKQKVIRANRDTPYTSGVFDLTSPVIIAMPKQGGRFQSLSVINEDHYIKIFSYKPGSYLLNWKNVGTRYAYVLIRTFMNPNSAADLEEAHKLQDEIKVKQDNVGKLELPEWDQTQRQSLHDALLAIGDFMPDSKDAFGNEREVDSVKHLISTAVGWGGNRAQDAIHLNVTPKDNSGATAYTLSVKKVPVDGFWSITVYNKRGLYEAPETAISVNNVTAQKEKDNSIVIHFGGDPTAANYLRIMPGWNYVVRMYMPRPEILEGKWKFPEAIESK